MPRKNKNNNAQVNLRLRYDFRFSGHKRVIASDKRLPAKSIVITVRYRQWCIQRRDRGYKRLGNY